jgi:hypothetical protein
MLLKLRQTAEKLRELGDSVHADEVESAKSARQDALRGLRDKLDLFARASDLIRFGRHQFSVNRPALRADAWCPATTPVPAPHGHRLLRAGRARGLPGASAAFWARRW